MKKTLLKILTSVLSVCMLICVLTACGGAGNWKGTTMTSWGNVKSHGGFVAETDSYIYYINGVGVSTDSNKFGAPIKGSLMAMQKSDLSKTEIVVPKLFVASDYNAGLFIDGEYVYYGTPSLDKSADGSIANNEMEFMKTRLDGKKTEELFKVSSLSTEYRIIKGENTVYIVYYDAEESALMSYSVNDKKATVIAKTDDKADKYSLSEYKFVVGAEQDIAVLYTVNIFSEKYLEDKAQTSGYQRATESYNNLYAYKVGDAVNSETGLAGKLIGSEKGYTYSIDLAGEYVLYTQTSTSAVGTAKTYGDTAKNILAKTEHQEIANKDYISEANLIVSLDEVYSFADGKIYRSTLIDNDKTNKTVVAFGTEISSLLFIKGSDIYYLTTSNTIARIQMNSDEANEIIVSEGTVDTAWYAPEIITIGEKDYIFYVDTSELGASYVKYADLSILAEEDTDDDGKNDRFFVDGAISIGVKTDADLAKIVEAQIKAIANELEEGVIPFEEVDDKLTFGAVTEARAEYDKLSKEAKKLFSEQSLKTLNNYEKAIEMANVYKKLDGMYGYASMTSAEQQAMKTAYEEIKEQINEFMSSSDFAVVGGFISNNAKWNFQKAEELFEAE